MIENQPEEQEFKRSRGERSEKEKELEGSIILQANISDHPRPPSNHSQSQLHQEHPYSQKDYLPYNDEPMVYSRPFRREQHVPQNIPEQTDTDFFGLFSCCTNPKVEPDLYAPPVVVVSRVRESRRRDEPYMSEIRMKNRQNKPINIYHDHLVSEKLSQSRWKTHV